MRALTRTGGFPSLRPIENSCGIENCFLFPVPFYSQCQLILGRIVGKRDTRYSAMTRAAQITRL